jgi:hypothetical protein
MAKDMKIMAGGATCHDFDILGHNMIDFQN